MESNHLRIIKRYDTLSSQQQKALQNLLTESVPIDGYYYDAELENSNISVPFPAFYLLYEESNIKGFLSFSIFPAMEGNLDIYAYALIHPKYRQIGLFTKLFNTAIQCMENTLKSKITLYFSMSDNAPQWLLDKLYTSQLYSYDYSEYIMKKQLQFSNFKHPELTLEYESIEDDGSFQDSNSEVLSDTGIEYSLWLDDTYIGGCRIAPINSLEAMIYEFAICSEEQGKGYGTAGLQLICDNLYKHNYTTVSLQVSGKNKIAHSLYLNCGFTITEEVKFFRYINLTNKSSDNN